MQGELPRETQSDGELARAVLAAPPGGALEAEEELLRRFGPRVRLFGLRHLGQEAAADELVQRVLLLLLEKLRSGALREPERVASFVLGAARTLALELHRRRDPAESLAPEHLELPAPEAPEPLDPERLAHCLGALGERERAVIVATFYLQQAAREIATALSLREGNVRVLRHRALGRLRDCLGLLEGAA